MIYLIAVSMAAPSVGFAQSAPPGVINSTTQPAATMNAEVGVGSVAGTGGGASQNQAAKMGQAQNNKSSGIANAIGAALMAAGAALMSNPPTMPLGLMLMMLGMMGMRQGGANAGTAGAHGAQSTLNQDYGTSPPPAGGGTSPVPSINAAVSELKKHGINYDASSGKFTLPNGKTISANDLTNQEAMAAAGFSAADFAKAMEMLKDAEKKAVADASKLDKMKAGFENAAGDGGGAMAASYRGPAEETPAGGPREKPAVSVAGMSVNLGGDRIGVAGDDIFAMMARRYREKNSKDAFLPPNAAPEGSFY